MNWFRNLFGMLSRFFVQFSKTAIAVLAEDLVPKIKELVIELEDSDMKGKDKGDKVMAYVKQNYGKNIEGVVINLAINMVLAIIREKIK